MGEINVTKYVLSFTALLQDRKEYVLALNKHTNVYNENDYLLAYNPWSTHTADIIDDMVMARKRRTKVSQVFLQEAELNLVEQGKIESDANKYGKAASKAELFSKPEKMKVIAKARRLPEAIEKGIVILKGTVDREVVASLVSKDANVIEVMTALQKKLIYEASTVSRMWGKTLTQGTKQSQEIATVLKDIFNAIDDRAKPVKGIPYRFMNVEESIGTLLHKLGYRSDALTAVESLSGVYVGDNIGAQLNGLLLQNIYKAVDLSINGAKLNSKAMFSINASTALRNNSVLYSKDGTETLEEMSIVFTEDARNDSLEEGKPVVTKKAYTVSSTENGKAITGSRAIVFKGHDKAVNAGIATNVFELEKSSVMASSDPAIVMSDDKATVKKKVEYAKTLIETDQAELVIRVYRTVPKRQESATLAVKLGSILHKSTDKAMLSAICAEAVHRLEQGNPMEGMDDVLLQFLMEGSDSTLSVDVEYLSLQEVEPDSGHKDVEYHKLTEFKQDGASRETFLTVLGQAEHEGEQEVLLGETIQVNPNIMSIDVLLDKLEKQVQEMDNKTVEFERLAPVNLVEAPKDVEYIELEVPREVVNPTDLFYEVLEMVDHKMAGAVDTVMDKLSPLFDTLGATDIIMGKIEDVQYISNPQDTLLDAVEHLKPHNGIQDVSMDRVENLIPINVDKDTVLDTVHGFKLGNVPKDVQLHTVEDISNHEGKQDVHMKTLTQFKEATEAKDVSLETLATYNNSSSVTDTVYDTLTQLRQDEAVREVHYDRVVKLGQEPTTTDVHLSPIEGYERDVELEAYDSQSEDGTRETMFKVAAPSELNGGETSTLLQGTAPVGESATIGHELEAIDHSPEEGNTFTLIKAQEPSTMETSTGHTELEAVENENHSTGTAHSNFTLDIVEQDGGSNNPSYRLEIGGGDGGETSTLVKTSAPTTHVSAEIDNEREAVDTGHDNSVRKDPDYKLSITGEDGGKKKDPDVKLSITDQDLGEDQTILRGTGSSSEGAIKDTEKEAVSSPEGDGGEVQHNPNPNPQDPPAPKEKIWLIMGKNYPAWQNWNPKKTR